MLAVFLYVDSVKLPLGNILPYLVRRFELCFGHQHHLPAASLKKPFGFLHLKRLRFHPNGNHVFGNGRLIPEKFIREFYGLNGDIQKQNEQRQIDLCKVFVPEIRVVKLLAILVILARWIVPNPFIGERFYRFVIPPHHVLPVVLVVLIQPLIDRRTVICFAEMIEPRPAIGVDGTDRRVFVIGIEIDLIPLQFHYADKSIVVPTHRKRVVYRLAHQIVLGWLSVLLSDIDRTRRFLVRVLNNRQPLSGAHLVGQVAQPVILAFTAIVFLSVPYSHGVENKVIVGPLLSRVKCLKNKRY